MAEKRIAIYPGTFDPVTNGHLDIMRRSLRLMDRLVVAVAHNPAKHPVFSIEERVQFIREATRKLRNIQVTPFKNLLVDCAEDHNATVIIKGLRAVSDFEYELQMGLMNRSLKENIETLFMIPSQEYSFLSSSFVREIARHNGDVSGMVPKNVMIGLKQKLSTRARR